MALLDKVPDGKRVVVRVSGSKALVCLEKNKKDRDV
jgi:hypothetical protein